jgi:hypothetical protein
VTKGQVLLVSRADNVNVTPRAAMAAIFCSKMSSNDETTLAANPEKLLLVRSEQWGQIMITHL